MPKVKRDANGNTIFRKDPYGRKIACANCVNNHRSSNCLPSHNEDVRVIDGVGRKKGSKNLPKDNQKAKPKVTKPASPRTISRAMSSPLQNTTQVQPVQAEWFLQPSRTYHGHPPSRVDDRCARPLMCDAYTPPVVQDDRAVARPVANYQAQMNPQGNTGWNNLNNWIC
ncbi:unnamed protein product [Fusarium langsethiae]|nr:unnamed protein product [Fusarium langsethiae]